MKKLTVALFGLATMFTANAYADEGLALGASVGHVNIEDDDPGFSFDANDTGYKFFASYTASNNLGVEGGYIDFGSPEDIVGGLAGWPSLNARFYQFPPVLRQVVYTTISH